jgi:hypothetical protein
MKTKYIFYPSLTLILTLLCGCEKNYDTVIENQNTSYQVVSVIVKDSLQYPIDSTATFLIEFSSSNGIKNVNFDIYSPENEKINSSPRNLLDNGNPANGDANANDDIYSAKINLDSNSLNGNYELKYYVTDDFNTIKQVATSKYYFNNGKSNVAPVISDDTINPDTLVVADTVVIYTGLKASDENGLDDIQKVYFVVYKPDGTTNNSQLELFDDGDFNNRGDLVAGDGIYSKLISVNQNNDKGAYRFEFRAKDRSNKLSNTINHTVLIQ